MSKLKCDEPVSSLTVAGESSTVFIFVQFLITKPFDKTGKVSLASGLLNYGLYQSKILYKLHLENNTII